MKVDKVFLLVGILAVMFVLLMMYKSYSEEKAKKDRLLIAQQNAQMTAQALSNVDTGDTGWLGGILSDIPIIGGLF